MSLSRGAILILVAALALSAGALACAASSGVAPAHTGSVEALSAARPVGGESSPASPLPQRTGVRIGLVPVIGTTAVYLAMDRGYFAAENIELEYETVQATSEAIAHVASGQLELASASIGAAVLNSLSRGVDIRVVGGVYGLAPSGHGGAPIVARKDLYDAGVVRDAAGLRGRRVGNNGSGVFSEYAIDATMRTAGLTIDDVETVLIPFPDIPNALANQAIDGAYLPEPAASAGVERGVAVPIVTDVVRGGQILVLVAGPTFLRDRAVAEAFLRAHLRGLADLTAEGFNSPSVAPSIERYTHVPAATVMKILPEYADPEARINWDSIMDQQRFYLERGYLNYSEPLDLARFVEDGPRQAALAALGR